MAVKLPAGVLLTPLRKIPAPGGPVMHALKATDSGFAGFGEAYFSNIEQGAVKAWKRHLRMVSNLVVPAGRVRLQFIDARADSPDHGQHIDLTLGGDNYQRLTLPPGFWFGFQGIDAGLNLMLNLASIAHDPSEAESLPRDHAHFAAISW